MKEKLKSRKLWITIGVGIVWGIVSQLGIDIPEQFIAVVVTYLFGQSAVDIAKAIADAKAKK